MKSDQLAAFERQCGLNSDILRMLVIKMDHRIADAFVQHVLEGAVATSSGGRRPAAVAE